MNLSEAFLEGSRRMGELTNLGNPVSIGNPVGTRSEYDPKTSPVYETAMSADKISQFGLKAGQVRGHHGTTIFNPKRNDPEVEAVLGKQEYKQKISKDSPEAIRLKQLDLENMIAQQQKQIDILTQLLAGEQPEKGTSSVPLSNSETDNWKIVSGEYKDWRTVAKAAGIKTFGRKKDEVVAELKEKGLM